MHGGGVRALSADRLHDGAHALVIRRALRLPDTGSL